MICLKSVFGSRLKSAILSFMKSANSQILGSNMIGIVVPSPSLTRPMRVFSISTFSHCLRPNVRDHLIPASLTNGSESFQEQNRFSLTIEIQVLTHISRYNLE